MWRAALAWSRNSATHLWSNIVIAVSAVFGAAIEFADPLAELLGDPDFKAQVLALVPHEYAPHVLIGVAVVTKIARNRTLPQ